MPTNGSPPNAAVETPHGLFLVQGVDRFPVAGDLAAAVEQAVADHVARTGRPPAAVVWDDLVIDYRPDRRALRLYRVAVPAGDPWLAAQLDGSARCAVRADLLGDDRSPALVLGGLDRPEDVARAEALHRFVGWPDAAPVTVRAFQPRHRAGSLSVVVNYRDKAGATLPCLAAIKRQAVAVPLQIILVDNQSTDWERAVVAAGAEQLFDGTDGVTVTHLTHDGPFNHSAQCNRAAAAATGEVLVMLSNDCVLLDPGLLQEMADWALEPGVGTVGPQLVAADGAVSSAGIGIGATRPDEPAPRVHDTTGRYLSGLFRRADGNSFACAAVSRAAWDAVGGMNEGAFPVDYNDADFCLRLTAAGYRHLYLGTRRARHSAGAGDHRLRELAEGNHARLAAAHRLDALPRASPVAAPAKPSPTFADPAATLLLEWCRLARNALDRGKEGTAAAEPVTAAMGRLAALTPPADADPALVAHWYAGVRTALKALVTAFLDSEPPTETLDRQRRRADRLASAATALAQAASRPLHPLPGPAADGSPAPPPPGATPDADPAYVSLSDPWMGEARHRLILFADALGPSPQVLFLAGLRRSRAARHTAVRVVTEEDLLNLRSARGEEAVGPWLSALFGHVQPTAVVMSRFASAPGFAAVRRELAGWPDVPLVAHLDDDFFSLPAVLGVDRYREARHPRRIHCLRAVADASDLLLAATAPLAERMAARFGADRVGLCPMAEAGVPPAPTPRGPGPVTIGYYGAATHNRDLEMIAPALARLKADHPDVTLEIVGSVARRPAAAALAGIATLDGELEHDYLAFRRSIAGRGWDIGLAPLASLPFNAAKTPIKWTEYAEAGIAVVASRTEPYVALGAAGAALLASPHEWHGRLTELVRHPERRDALVRASACLLAGYRGWNGLEDRLLGLLDRAAMRRRHAQAAA
jgi:GT2 family glycosyltransferase